MKTSLMCLIEQFPPPDGRVSNYTTVTCKFVVIREDDTLSLVIGDVGKYPYHATLISEFCRENGIKSRWIKKPDVIRVCDEEVAIRGGGWAEIIPGTRSCKVYGRSNAYGRYDSDEVRTVLSGQELLSEYRVTVE